MARKPPGEAIYTWTARLLFWILLLGGAVAAGSFLLTSLLPSPIAGKYYSYELQFDHGLSLGGKYAGEKEFVGNLEKHGFTLVRKMSIDDFEFQSPQKVYLFRVKTAKGKITALYHYLNHGVARPANRVDFLGDSKEELVAALGEPTYIVVEPVLRYVYELADADLSISFGSEGWVVETIMQRPIRRSTTPPN
jgi:hypothetical protein